ncbi:TetR/AcrR family transcriptional regulator [Ralstonia sp. GP101]|uniref:TetR/AcrR family transcriptional regulator n=1 Tax=unclassified Ralstonia TaxID=209769 RepID=UPI00389282CE
MEDHDRMTISSAGVDSASAGTQSGHASRRSRSERAVLDAARELLAESGFGSLTVEGVATRAGGGQDHDLPSLSLEDGSCSCGPDRRGQ